MIRWDQKKIASILKRAKSLPKRAGVMVRQSSKSTAEEMQRIMKRGLMTQGWLSPALKPATKAAKRRARYQFPNLPLVTNPKEAGTMLDTLAVRQVYADDNRAHFRFGPYGTHKKSKLPAKVIWAIHENGTVIHAPNGALIVIPARHPFRNAMRDFDKLKPGRKIARRGLENLRKQMAGPV